MTDTPRQKTRVQTVLGDTAREGIGHFSWHLPGQRAVRCRAALSHFTRCAPAAGQHRQVACESRYGGDRLLNPVDQARLVKLSFAGVLPQKQQNLANLP